MLWHPDDWTDLGFELLRVTSGSFWCRLKYLQKFSGTLGKAVAKILVRQVFTVFKHIYAVQFASCVDIFGIRLSGVD